MRRIFYTLFFTLILIAGLFIGIVRGQEVRNKWISKMKFRHEEKRDTQRPVQKGGVMLDEVEEASWHS